MQCVVPLSSFPVFGVVSLFAVLFKTFLLTFRWGTALRTAGCWIRASHAVAGVVRVGMVCRTFVWNLFDIRNMATEAAAAGIEGKVAVVTGASSGIGAGIALALAKAGAKVAIGARRMEKLEEVAKSITDEVPGAVVKPVVVDVTDGEQVKAFVAEATAALGPVDILVNNGEGGVVCLRLAGWMSSRSLVLPPTAMPFAVPPQPASCTSPW